MEKYVYHKGGDPKDSTAVRVLAADDPARLGPYPGKLYAIPVTCLTAIPDWVKEMAEEFYEEDGINVDPADIVDSAEVWDDFDFVVALWERYEAQFWALRDQGIVGFKTWDGAVIFPGPDVPSIRD